jgi:predicted N-formylglutamate amidohydrolase
MDQAWHDIEGDAHSSLLLIGDHASNHVPPNLNLGLTVEALGKHIAYDIGVADLGRMLCAALLCPGIFGATSRLVVDLNREEDAPHIIPLASDGHIIPGNALSPAERLERIATYWHPYHARIERQIAAQRPKLLLSLHSFTPQLATAPDERRPWEIGILYNQDDRAARIAIPTLTEAGVVVGDQLPYSGKLLNATMNRHGEGNDIAYLGIEMRQDLIEDDAGVARWASRLAPLIRDISEAFA